MLFKPQPSWFVNLVAFFQRVTCYQHAKKYGRLHIDTIFSPYFCEIKRKLFVVEFHFNENEFSCDHDTDSGQMTHVISWTSLERDEFHNTCCDVRDSNFPILCNYWVEVRVSLWTPLLPTVIFTMLIDMKYQRPARWWYFTDMITMLL